MFNKLMYNEEWRTLHTIRIIKTTAWMIVDIMRKNVKKFPKTGFITSKT